MNTLASLILLLLVGHIGAQTYTPATINNLNSPGSPPFTGGTAGLSYLAQGAYITNAATSSYNVLQYDGNYCVYTGSYPGSSNSVAIWCDNNFGTGICSNNAYGKPLNYVILQSDGNLVKYCGSNPSHKGAFLWGTGIIPEYYTIEGYALLAGGNTSISNSNGGLMVQKWCLYQGSPVNVWGQCGACGSGLTSCSSWGGGTYGGCTNTDTDVLNCGSCGNACGEGDSNDGTMCCGGTCYNADGSYNDPRYCGNCSQICEIAYICTIYEGRYQCILT